MISSYDSFNKFRNLVTITRPNAKSHIASSKAHMKTGTFTAKPKTYALKAIEWHNAVDRKLKSIFYTEFENKPLEKKAQEQLQHEAKKINTLDEIWGAKAKSKEKILTLLYCENISYQSQRQMQRIEEHYNELRNQLHNLQNIKKRLAKSQPYEIQRHERENVKEYHKEWALRMMNCQKKWNNILEDNESIIKKRPRIIDYDQRARVIIKPEQTNGYWKSEDMVKQLHEKAIPIFNFLYP
ncbi:31673_t:CDS:2, partial [Gigaspora margarita]